jgi:hypothetical protein
VQVCIVDQRSPRSAWHLLSLAFRPLNAQGIIIVPP